MAIAKLLEEQISMITKKKTQTKKSKNEKLVSVPIKKRKDKNKDHPHIILERIGDKRVSVGMTHDQRKGKNNTNYKLERNPLGGDQPSYIRRQAEVNHKSSYYGETKIGSMTQKDYSKAKSYGDKAKEKYYQKKKKK
jgi:hypothetical protein